MASFVSWLMRGVGAVTLLSLVACTGSKPSDAGSSPTPSVHAPVHAPSASPTDPRLTAVQDALTAYRGMWQAYIAASNAGDPQSPDLAKYASGSALTTLVTGLTNNKSKGLTTKGSPQLNPVQTGFSPDDAPTSVTVGDCLDDSHWLLYKPTGDLADNTPGGRHRVTATVVKGDEGWKVTAFAAQGVGTC
jgi:hypothetical protein